MGLCLTVVCCGVFRIGSYIPTHKDRTQLRTQPTCKANFEVGYTLTLPHTVSDL